MSWPEERQDGTVDVVTRGGGISKGGTTRNLWLEHWSRGRKGSRRSQSGFKRKHGDGDYKEVEGDLEEVSNASRAGGALSERE